MNEIVCRLNTETKIFTLLPNYYTKALISRNTVQVHVSNKNSLKDSDCLVNAVYFGKLQEET